MLKSELIDQVATHANTSKAVAERVLDSLCTVITEALKDGEEVPLVGVGKFSAVDRGPRTIKTPLAGQTVNIPARVGVRFSPSTVLKRELN